MNNKTALYFSTKVVPAGAPDPPINCSADPGPKHYSLNVFCDEGFDGGLPQKFLMQVWQDEDEEAITNYTR